jgi:L-cysteine:1D-myo-inositol 2-amino-2-deoxy-alpha-D-glucopyranoside ligase
MKLYSSLSKTLETFKPLETKNVSIYVCGITPYDTTHLGHAFVYVFFDTLIRYLRSTGYEVNYTQNVTDIDDDILKRAKKEGRDWKELGQWWTDKFVKDTTDINIIPPTHYVKATDSIPEIIKIVQKLIEKKCAYEVDGTVFYAVDSDSEYGKLSGFNVEEMIALSRERGADPDDKRKRNPLDFILWQKSLPDEPSWESPWGEGRPGWHIECSAMISQYLGDQIDIHGGGGDLIYPHHESEIAQSESATGKSPFVSYWMHVAMLSYQGEKMSKSLGNLVLVSELLKTYTPNQIRFLLLSHHYRQPWEFKEEEFTALNIKLGVIEQVARRTDEQASPVLDKLEKEFFAGLDNDMDVPYALGVLERIAAEPNSSILVRKLFLLLGFEV